MASDSEEKIGTPLWRRLPSLKACLIGLALMVIVAAGVFLLPPVGRPAILDDPRFITYNPERPGGDWGDRAERLWFGVLSRFKKLPPQTPVIDRFTAMATNQTTVKIVGHCAWITGYHYLVETNVASGFFTFGYPSSLISTNWAARVTETLQTAPVSWQDSETKTDHNESLVLLTNQEARIVYVIPKHMTNEFE